MLGGEETVEPDTPEPEVEACPDAAEGAEPAVVEGKQHTVLGMQARVVTLLVASAIALIATIIGTTGGVLSSPDLS